MLDETVGATIGRPAVKCNHFARMQANSEHSTARAGSDPNAACGGKSEVSEWQRSTDAKALRRRRQMSGTATGNVAAPTRLP